MVMKSLKDEPLGVSRVRCHNATILPSKSLSKGEVGSLGLITEKRVGSIGFSKIIKQSTVMQFLSIRVLRVRLLSSRLLSSLLSRCSRNRDSVSTSSRCRLA